MPRDKELSMKVHSNVIELKDDIGNILVTITREMSPGHAQRAAPFAALHPVRRPALRASVLSCDFRF